MTNQGGEISVKLTAIILLRLRSMFLIRATLSLLLCGAVLLGQPAVWMHVGSCGGNSDAHSARTIRSDECKPDVTCCQHAQVPIEERSDTGDNSSDHAPHDSDSCATCHLLAAPSDSGLVYLVSHPLRVQPEDQRVASERAPSQILRDDSRPRGPPASV